MNRLILLLALTFPAAGDVRELLDRAVADFEAGRMEKAVAGFDQAADLEPRIAPQLWQRGIAQYYAGRYKDCRVQFESHRTVNPDDVENAAWHFLCVARISSAADARRQLLPVGPDTRVPMGEIYRMFRGEITPEQMKKSAGSGVSGQFYALLYSGLYAEAVGDSRASERDLRAAADPRFARAGGYMHTVARVHAAILQNPVRSEIWNFDRLDRLGSHPTKVLGNPKVIDSPEGKAIEFDGVDDAIFVDVHPLARAATFTWEVIFRPDSGGAREQRFFHLQEKGTQTRLLFETRLIEEKWYLDSFAMSGNASKPLMRPDLKHPLDRWHHVAMVYDGREFRNYVDGELQMSAEIRLAPQGAGQTSAGVRINLVDYFKGAIAKARFTHRALGPTEFLRVTGGGR